MNKRIAYTAMLLMLCAPPAYSITVEQPLASHKKERIAQHLFAQLKCVVCEGQPLSVSDAELAGDRRGIIRDKLKQDESEAAILDYFVARYGESILQNPPLSRSTGLLWAMPWLLLAAGIALLIRHQRRAP
jgi:cytochrome c-type biogenesis protein CcmH